MACAKEKPDGVGSGVQQEAAEEAELRQLKAQLAAEAV